MLNYVYVHNNFLQIFNTCFNPEINEFRKARCPTVLNILRDEEEFKVNIDFSQNESKKSQTFFSSQK